MSNEEFKEYIKKYVKEDLLNEFKWLEDIGTELCYNGYTVVCLTDLDVNYLHWHSGTLTSCYSLEFNGSSENYLSISNYEDFKRALRDYEEKYIKGE